MNLDINYRSVLGFALPQLPYFESTLKLAFPDFDIKEILENEEPAKQHQFEFRKPDNDDLLFDVTGQTFWSDEQQAYISGYPHLLRVRHSDILIFDKYRVGQSCLREFTSPAFNLIDFDPLEESIECNFEIGKHLTGGFYFDPPKGYSGSIKSMNEEQIGDCVLSFAYFVVGLREDQLTSLESEQQGVTFYQQMLSEHNGELLTSKEEQNALTPVSPVKVMLKKSFDFRSAISAYLRLSNLAVHTGVKTKVKKALQEALDKCGTDYPGPEELFEVVLFEAPSDNPTAWPLFSIDWKDTIKDGLDYGVRGQLGKLVNTVDLSDLSSIPDTAGLLDNDHLYNYAKQLEQNGYDLYWGGLAQTDSHEFLLAPIENRNKMKIFIRDSRSNMSLIYDLK